MVVRALFLPLLVIIASYESLGVRHTEVPLNEGPSMRENYSEVPVIKIMQDEELINEVPTYGVRTTEISPNRIPITAAPTDKVATTGVPTTKMPTTEVLTTIMPTTEAPIAAVPTIEILATVVPSTEVTTTEEPTAIAPTTEPPNIKSVKGQMTVLIKDTNDVCNRIRNIDAYENVVMATLSLRKSLSYQTMFNVYTEDYNRDLKAIRDHMNFWRKGNSIVGEMKAIYELAKKFEDEYERKLEIFQERIPRAPSESKRRIAQLNREIEKLKEDKQNLRSQLVTVHAAVRPYIQSAIASMKAQLKEKEYQKRNSSPLAMELNELVSFLGFVKMDAITVRDKTLSPVKKLEELYSNVQTDNSIAYQYFNNITSDVTSLTRDKLEYENTSTLKNAKLQKLEQQQEDFDAKQSSLRKTLDEISANISHISSQFEEKRKTFDKEKKTLCDPNGSHLSATPPAKWTSTPCAYILHHKGMTYEKEVEELQEQLNSSLTERYFYLEALNELQTQGNNITEQIRIVKDGILALRKRIEEIQAELRQFSVFQSDVERLMSDMKSVLPHIAETRKGLLIVQATFELVIEDINNIIGLVESADTEEDRNSVRESAGEAIELLQEQLSNSSQKICDVNQCSFLAFSILL